MFFVMLSLAIRQGKESIIAQRKMFAYIIFAIAGITFFTLYQLAPMGMNLFIDRNVDRHFMGFLIAPQWVQNINTVVIILGGPILGMLFTHLRERGINISIPLQFSIALICIGTAFAILPIGITQANTLGLVNFNWIIICYLLQSLGELFIGPIGYAMIGQLAPIKLRGLMMGTWMMLTGIAAILSDHFSKMVLSNAKSINPIISNASYSHTFGSLGITALAIGISLLIITPWLARLTNEVSPLAKK